MRRAVAAIAIAGHMASPVPMVAEWHWPEWLMRVEGSQSAVCFNCEAE